MIKIITTKEFTNGWDEILKPWTLVREPYMHYETSNCTGPHSKLKSTYLNCAKGFDETKPCKIIKTMKGTELLVNGSKDEDKNIGLITIKSPIYKGGFNIYGSDVKIGIRNEYTMIHNKANVSFVAEFKNKDSFLYINAGDGKYNHKYIFITWDNIEYCDDDDIEKKINDYFKPSKEKLKISIDCTEMQKEEIRKILSPLNKTFGDNLSINVTCSSIARYRKANDEQFENIVIWVFYKDKLIYQKNKLNPYNEEPALITKKLIDDINGKLQ